MAELPLDPTGFFEFDLAQGAVRTSDGRRTLVLSEQAVARLVTTAVEAGDLTAVRVLGSELGELAERALPGSGSAVDQTPAGVFGAAAAVVALYGWGRLSAERWGPAVVLEVTGAAPLDSDHLACAALLGGLFSRLSGSEVACVPVTEAGRYLMVDPGIAERIWNWSREGDDLGVILSKLEPAGAG